MKMYSKCRMCSVILFFYATAIRISLNETLFVLFCRGYRDAPSNESKPKPKRQIVSVWIPLCIK